MNGRRLIPGKPVPASEIPDYTIARDTLEETPSTAFRDRLTRLNTIVSGSREPLEGNIFYPDLDATFVTSPPAVALAPARRAAHTPPLSTPRNTAIPPRTPSSAG